MIPKSWSSHPSEAQISFWPILVYTQEPRASIKIDMYLCTPCALHQDVHKREFYEAISSKYWTHCPHHVNFISRFVLQHFLHNFPKLYCLNLHFLV